MFATEYYMWLSCAAGAGSEKTKKLFEYFGNIESIYKAEKFDYLKAGIRENSKQMQALCNKNLDKAKSIAEYCHKNNVYILTYDAPLFPKAFKSIPTPPVLLYCKGRMIDFNDSVCVGMVGSRSCTVNGLATAYGIAHKCAQSGVVVTSGLAEGIDAACMRGALDARGITVGFIANGIDIVYPKCNATLYERTAQSGVIMTEYAPGTRPMAANFICRNRLIAALSLGTVMFEGTMRSGAMSTMKYAGEFGKTLYAMPGPITASVSAGPNLLIKNGAKIVTESKDILNDFIYLYPHALTPSDTGDFPQKIAIPPDLLDESNLRSGKQSSNARTDKKPSSAKATNGTKKPKQMTVFPQEAKAQNAEVSISGTVATHSGAIPEIAEEPISMDFSDSDNSQVEQNQQRPISTTSKVFVPLAPDIADVVGDEAITLYSMLGDGKGKTCDELALASGLDIDKVLTAVSLLEAFGAVVQKPGGIIELI